MWQKFINSRTGLLFTFVLLASVPFSGVWAQDAMSRSPLVLVSGAERHDFTVEVATTDSQHRMGLMYRTQLAIDAGMLFHYGASHQITMWMKNTLISLDMIFISGDGRIVSIAENTVPFSLAVISSGGLAQAVLEVNAGTAARLGLKTGDRAEHALFKGISN